MSEVGRVFPGLELRRPEVIATDFSVPYRNVHFWK